VVTRAFSAKADYIQYLFARLAPHYDRMNWLMTLGRHQSWRDFVSAQADPPQGGLVLDVATGTCDLSLALAGHESVCHVVGVDVSLPMMALGRQKVAQAGLNERITLLPGDALYLPFADDTFDGVTSGFALRNVVSIEQTLTEMTRVTKPGGRVVCLELTAPRIPLFRQVYHVYFHLLIPLLGQLVAGLFDEYAYLPRSLDEFVSPEELKEMMEQAGLQSVQFTYLTWQTVAVHVGVKP
jgi:demethylmenaquinone methyltransferase/2-methoxy-6-polyprenyl-1,4-benzoquinol methylase